MALQLRRGHTSNFGKTIAASFAVLALIIHPLASGNIPAAFAADGIDTQAELESAIADTTQSVIGLTGSFAVTQQITISRPLTLNGGGNSITPTFTKTSNSNNAAIGIQSSGVTVNSLTIEGASGTNLHGINVFASENVTLNNLTTKNNDYSGLAVNGSKVTVNSVVTSGNGWHGVNVDKAGAVLTVTGVSQHADALQVYADSALGQVVDTNTQYSVRSNVLRTGDKLYYLKIASPSNLRLNGDKPCGYITNVNSITPTWNAVPGASSYNYKVTLPNGSVYGPTNVGNVTSVTGAFGAEGTSSFSVQAVDAFGGVSNWAEPCAVTYDKTAPATPTNGQPRDGAYKTTNDFYFTWNASTGAATYEFQSSGSNAVDGGGSLVGSWNSIANGNSEQNNLTTPQIHSTGAPDGHYYWQVRAIDAAGNKSAWSTVWDMRIDQKPAAPVLTVDGLTSGGSTNSYTITARWNKPAPDVVKYLYEYWNDIPGNQYKESTPYSTELASESSTGVFNQGEGTHFIRVYAIDSIGTRSDASNTFQITYDTTKPQVTLDDITTVNEGQNSTINGTVSDANSTTAVLYADGLARASTTVSGGQYSFAIQLSQGTHDIYVVASDSASNNTASETKVATVNQVIVGPEEPEEETPTGNTGNPIIPDTTSAPDVDTEDEADNSNESDEIEQLQIFTQPIVVVNNPAVLGDSNVADSNQIAESGDTSDQSVMGTTDEKKNSTFSPLGFAWYWWLLVLAAIAGLWWLLAALRRRNAEQDV